MKGVSFILKKRAIALSAACVLAISAVFGANSIYKTFAANKGAASKKTEVSSQTESTDKTATSSQASQIDINSLSNKKIGWGQGTNFDDQNRPQDAVSAQNQYGNLDANFIDLSGEKVIYLTFDEGYENGYTSKILDVLKEKNVKATFFITGDYAKAEPELVKRMIAEGHVVGNHTWKHYSMPEKSLDTCRNEIKELHDYVQQNYNYEMKVFRPPMGEFSEQTLAVTQEMGYKTMFWSFAYKDWDANNQGDPATCLNKLNERLHCGAIYLLHAVSSTNADILGDFIDHAQSEGYKFILPE